MSIFFKRLGRGIPVDFHQDPLDFPEIFHFFFIGPPENRRLFSSNFGITHFHQFLFFLLYPPPSHETLKL